MQLKTALLVLCFVTSSVKAAIITPDSEHTIWVKIDTIPSTAELYAPPTDNEPPSIRIGTTPCMIAVDLSWGVKWFKKRWELISVRSPGDICRYVFQSDASYDLYLNFVAIKPGYKPKAADLHIATLKDPGLDWERETPWPTEQTLNLELIPADKKEAGDNIKTSTPRTVLLAGGGITGEAGTLSILANVEGARVYIDDQFAGGTPIQVVLPEGRHSVRIQNVGFQPMQKDIQVTSDEIVTLKAVLTP